MAIAERVIIIGWDGAGNFVKDANTPNLDRVAARGLGVYDAQTVSPTISAECWGSLLHGVEPDKHGLNNDRAEKMEFADDSPFPSLFRLARETWPDANLASFSAWAPINYGIIEPSCDVIKKSLPDRELAIETAAYIRENPDLKLLFVQLDNPDAAGHKYGYSTVEQCEAISETDELTGIILNAIEEAGMLDNSLIILVSDHGGGGEMSHGHGSDHPMDKTIFWVCAGPGVMSGSTCGNINIMDTAAVAAHALGLTPPPVWEAKVPSGIFSEES